MAGCGIREILRTGYGMKITWRDRDALHFNWWDAMGRDSFEIDSMMRNFRQQRFSKWRNGGTKPKLVAGCGCGISKAYFGPLMRDYRLISTNIAISRFCMQNIEI